MILYWESKLCLKGGQLFTDSPLPNVIGFCGGYSTGKTSTAKSLVPNARVMDGNERIVWDHLFYAMPLYRMHAAKRDIVGENSKERIYYEIHDTLVELLGNNPLYGAPKYDHLISLVKHVSDFPIPMNDKPREFFQTVGTDWLRAYKEDIFVDYIRKQIQKRYRDFLRDYYRDIDNEEDKDSAGPELAIIVSDCRFKNELELIKSFNSSLLIKFRAKPETVKRLMIERDGKFIDKKHSEHEAETSINDLPDDYFDEIIDIDDLTLKEQTAKVRDTIRQRLGV